MNESSEHESLLADVLAADSEPGFREALLGQTLKLVRRKRRFRTIRRGTSTIAVFAGLLLLVWRFVPSPPISPQPSAKPYALIRTQPLPPGAIVQTSPLRFPNLVTSSHDVQIIATSSTAHNFRELDDDQLLELAAPSPVILVRHGPDTAELVFVDPEARETILRD